MDSINLPLGSNRAVVRSRHTIRQIAALVGFDESEQAVLAAATFALARQAKARGARELHVQLDSGYLRVVSHAGVKGASTDPNLHVGSHILLSRRLPGTAAARLTLDDIAWAVGQLNQAGAGHIIEEIDRQNTEVLALARALTAMREEVNRLKNQRAGFAA